jgi:hypothetical protein
MVAHGGIEYRLCKGFALTEVAPQSNPSKLRRAGRSALRIALAVVGIVTLALGSSLSEAARP